jgi:NAD(P)-dependent dehydrogenase (short-subunit alcohol dehydrogenase family)
MRRVNVEGLINTTRTVMKGMRKRRYGRIVNVSSIAAIGTALPGKRHSGRSAQCNICGVHRPATGPSVAPLVPAQAGTRQEPGKNAYQDDLSQASVRFGQPALALT